MTMSALFAYTVEVQLGPLGWVDITADVRAEPGLTVRRGVRRPGHHADHTTLNLRLDNGAGRYSWHNPASDLHPHLGRNTPIRVSAGRAGGPLVGRFWGEVSSWSRGWSTTGAARWVDLECAGLLRRWGRGASPSWSAVRHAIEATNPVAYWPLEDGELVESAGAAVSTAPPMNVIGEVEFRPLESRRITAINSTYTLSWAVAALADLAAGGSLSAQVPAEATAATGAAKAHTLHVIWQTLLATSRPDVDYVLLEWVTQGGTLTRWQMRVTAIPTRTQFVAIDVDGVEWVVVEEFGYSSSLTERSICLSEVNGIVYLEVYDAETPRYSGSVWGTLGAVTSVSVNPGRVTSDSIFPVGHLALWASGPPPVLPAWSVRDPFGVWVLAHLHGHEREDAADRIVRAAAEAGVTVDVSDVSHAHPTRMGVQPVGTAAEVIAAAIEVDGGMLSESRDSEDLLYRRRVSLYNQTPLTLDYGAGLLVPPVAPVDDDELARNDITIRRTDGGSARATQTTGPLAALPPPDGVGVYQDERTLLLMSDAQLADHVGWTLHLGTVDEPRVPGLTVQLAAPAWQADPAALDAALAVDAGDVIDVVGLPDWLAADLPRLRLLITEYTETLTAHGWQIMWTGDPATPWDVAAADGPQRVPADGSTIAAVSDTALTLTLTSTAANGPWSVDPADFPMDLRIGGGERVTATGITGTGLTQTVTLSARAVNGVSRAWPDGTEVQVWAPAVTPL